MNKFQIPSEFMPHPFFSYEIPKLKGLGYKCVSIARIDFDKNTDILLKANRLLTNKENHVYLTTNIFVEPVKYRLCLINNAVVPKLHAFLFRVCRLHTETLLCACNINPTSLQQFYTFSYSHDVYKVS